MSVEDQSLGIEVIEVDCQKMKNEDLMSKFDMRREISAKGREL